MAEMLEIPVYDMSGATIGTEQIDPAALGGKVRASLLKQAIIAFEAGQRQGTMASKSRAMVHGASRKLYRQKGTGNARAGNLRTPVRRGGGHAFHKINRDFDQPLPKRMRVVARNAAFLAKIRGGSAIIIDPLKFDAPKTKVFAGMLKSVGAAGSCLVATAERDMAVWKSGRNIPGVEILPLAQVNAYHVLKPRRVIFTREAFLRLKGSEKAE